MNPDRYLELLRRDGDLLVASAERDLAVPVPSCPGWSVRDVVEHTAGVYQHKLACMRLGRRPDPWPPEDFAGREPLGFIRESLDELLAELRARGAHAPAYTWYPPDQTVGFWMRRMAQETAVHRVDAQLAFGPPSPVDDELAVDGVDEVLHLFLGYGVGSDPDEHVGGDGRRVAVRTGGRGWLVELHPDTLAVRDSDEDGDSTPSATVHGPPDAVLLWLWGRRPDEAVHFDGDVELLAFFRKLLAHATE